MDDVGSMDNIHSINTKQNKNNLLFFDEARKCFVALPAYRNYNLSQKS